MTSHGLLSIAAIQACQLSLLVGLVWLLTRTVTKNNAHLSYALWLVVLLKCFTPPILSSPLGLFSWLYANGPAIQTDEILAPVMLDPHARDFGPPPPQRVQFISPPSGKEAEVMPASAAKLVPSISKPVGKSHALTRLLWCVTATWLGIAVAMILWTVYYSRRCIGRLLRSRVRDHELQHKTQELCKTLRLKSTVRLVVTSCPVGPAVTGLLRPTIVVPEFIARRRTAQEMEPILAHELIHIRRGDLWVGMLRHLARSLWWFHPLVWLTSSAVRHEAEQCCDEEVIATLKIPPSDYARALLGVLELKHELKTLPVVLGVRPIDITSKRMERIMKLRHGSHAKSPLWCWAIALLLALLSLPGAGLAQRGGSNPEENPHQAPDHEIGPASAVLKPAKARKADPVEPDKPIVMLECLFVTGRQRDIRSIPVDWQVMTGSTMRADDPDKSDANKGPRAYEDWHVQSRVVTEKQLPIAYGILDADLANTLFKKVRGDEQFTVVSRPQIMVPDGSCGMVQTGNRKSFVVGLRDGEHEVRTIDCGLSFRVQPRIQMVEAGAETNNVSLSYDVVHHATNKVQRSGAETTDVSLSYDLVMTEVLDVDEVTWHTKDGAGITVQVPETQSAVVSGTNLIPTGKSLAIHGLLSIKANDQRESTLIVVRPTVFLPAKVAGEKQPDPRNERDPDERGDTHADLPDDVESGQTTRADVNPYRERWKLSLQECIAIGLGNSQSDRVRIHEPNQATPVLADSSPLLRSGPAVTQVNNVLTLVQPDASLAEVEGNVGNYLLEVIHSYWDLYFHHHNLHAARAGFENAHATWKTAATRYSGGAERGSSAEEAQARGQYFAFRSRLEQASNDLYAVERRLRYLLGLAATDGRLIQPMDEPAKARLELDWKEAKQSALSRRPEIRRHAQIVKHRASQLLAAREQLLAKVDAKDLYRIMEWDDERFSPAKSGELDEADFQEWKLGFEFSMPLGLRRELTAVRNLELRLRRDEKLLQEIEMEITHQLSVTVRALQDQYQIAQTSFNTLVAYRDQVDATRTAYEVSQTAPLDLLLESQRNLAQAKVDYYRAITQYNLAIAEVQHRKGTLIETLGYALAEPAPAAELDTAIERL